MNWLTQLFSSHETKLSQRAAAVAAGCQEQVWRVIVDRAGELSPAEARGYVRARAGLIVEEAVDRAIAHGRLASEREALRRMATDHVVQLIATQLRAVKATRRELRRAA